MSCVDLGLTLPTVPDFFLPNPSFNVPLPIGIDGPCCSFQIPDPGINALIKAANAAVSTTLLTPGIMAAVMTVNEMIGAAQNEINKLRIRIPQCPNDSIE